MVGVGVLGEDAAGGEQAEEALQDGRVRVALREELRGRERGVGAAGPHGGGDAEADDGRQRHGDGDHVGQLHHGQTSLGRRRRRRRRHLVGLVGSMSEARRGEHARDVEFAKEWMNMNGVVRSAAQRGTREVVVASLPGPVSKRRAAKRRASLYSGFRQLNSEERRGRTTEDNWRQSRRGRGAAQQKGVAQTESYYYTSITGSHARQPRQLVSTSRTREVT